MKINKAKVTVTSLAIAAVAAMVGSISGTVAWFQYSTRASVAYTAATAHASESIQIRVADGEWKSALEASEIVDFIKEARNSEDTALRPVTTGAQKKDGRLNKLYKSPIYQYASMSSWEEAGALDYVQIPLELRALDIDGKATETTLSKDVWLTKMQIEQPNADVDHKDISNALRVHLESNQNDNDFLVSKTGDDVEVAGKLDLNGNGRDDMTEGWDGFNDEREYVHYGLDNDQYRGEAANAAEIMKKFSDVAEGDIYHNTDGNDYVYRNGTWVVLNTGNPTAKYAGVKANVDAAFADICKPDTGSIYKNTGNSNFYLYDGSAWNLRAPGVDFGRYDSPEAAKLAKAKTLVADGKVWQNPTASKAYVWDNDAWVYIEDLAVFEGTYANEDTASLELGKEKMAEGATYKTAEATPVWNIWQGGAWVTLETSGSYLGAYANDAAAQAAHADADLTGKIYKKDASYRKFNGTAWEDLAADSAETSGDAAILDLTDPDDGAIILDSSVPSYKKFTAGAWEAVAADIVADNETTATLGVLDPALPDFAAGDFYVDSSGEDDVLKMYNGSDWFAVIEADSDDDANMKLKPIEKGTVYSDTALKMYRYWDGDSWEESYDISAKNATAGVAKQYANENDAYFAMNQNRHLSDSKKLAQGDVYFNTAGHYEKLFIDGEGNFAWGTSAIQAHSYEMNDSEITADDTNPRAITGGKVLGKTVVKVADEAALNALENKAEGDLAYRDDNHLQYVYEGGAWKANVDETVSTAADFTDDSKVYYLDTLDGDYPVGIYENIDGDWVARNGENLRVTVTIYLEGWQKLDGSAIWNAEDYVGAQFNVGLRFSGEAHVDHK